MPEPNYRRDYGLQTLAAERAQRQATILAQENQRRQQAQQQSQQIIARQQQRAADQAARQRANETAAAQQNQRQRQAVQDQQRAVQERQRAEEFSKTPVRETAAARDEAARNRREQARQPDVDRGDPGPARRMPQPMAPMPPMPGTPGIRSLEEFLVGFADQLSQSDRDIIQKYGVEVWKRGKETGVYDVTPPDPFRAQPGVEYRNMPTTPMEGRLPGYGLTDVAFRGLGDQGFTPSLDARTLGGPVTGGLPAFGQQYPGAGANLGQFPTFVAQQTADRTVGGDPRGRVAQPGAASMGAEMFSDLNRNDPRDAPIARNRAEQQALAEGMTQGEARAVAHIAAASYFPGWINTGTNWRDDLQGVLGGGGLAAQVLGGIPGMPGPNEPAEAARGKVNTDLGASMSGASWRDIVNVVRAGGADVERTGDEFGRLGSGGVSMGANYQLPQQAAQPAPYIPMTAERFTGMGADRGPDVTGLLRQQYDLIDAAMGRKQQQEADVAQRWREAQFPFDLNYQTGLNYQAGTNQPTTQIAPPAQTRTDFGPGGLDRHPDLPTPVTPGQQRTPVPYWKRFLNPSYYPDSAQRNMTTPSLSAMSSGLPTQPTVAGGGGLQGTTGLGQVASAGFGTLPSNYLNAMFSGQTLGAGNAPTGLPQSVAGTIRNRFGQRPATSVAPRRATPIMDFLTQQAGPDFMAQLGQTTSLQNLGSFGGLGEDVEGEEEKSVYARLA